MAANAISNDFDGFRREWVLGHLDHQRAADALESARRIAAATRAAAGAVADPAEVRRAEQRVQEALRRLAEIESILAGQFDRFCGLSTR
ncbi:MAG TPA: hypothetical protein VE987_19855 [Polyangiaceae bacterium]|nr:hypothetical protein [Polyangiaceae bacterium]